MGCVKLQILDEQYKSTGLKVSYFNKKLTSNFCAENVRSYQLYLYNGKEKQTIISGLSLIDYGARMYDPEIARWLTQDPLQEKYYGISSYAFCAGNPLKFVDPDGRTLELTGKIENISATIAVMNEFIPSDNKIFRFEKGNKGLVKVRSISDDERGNLSEGQIAFYDAIKSVVDDSHTVSIEIVKNSNALLGDYGWNTKTGTIDISDINALGTGEAHNKFSMLGHEIAEQYKKQTTSNPNYPDCHKYGISVENKISGYERQPLKWDYDNESVMIPYVGKTQQVNVYVITKNGNIVSVNRKIIKKDE